MSIEPTAYQIEKDNLAQRYPTCRNDINRGLYYASYQPIGMNGCGVAGAQDIGQLRVNRLDDYWKPDPDLRVQIAESAAGKRNALQPLPAGAVRKPGRAHRDTPYDPSLFDYLVEDVVRLSRFEFGGSTQSDYDLVFEKASYLDQLGTNIGGNVEEIRSTQNSAYHGKMFHDLDICHGGILKQFHDCQQANTIGVASIFVGKDFVPVIPWRKLLKPANERSRVILQALDRALQRAASDKERELAVMNHGWHCTSSGALNWSDLVEFPASNREKGRELVDGILRGMQREIQAETALRPWEYTLHPTYFARELMRGGKPQFFFLGYAPQVTSVELAQIIFDRQKERLEQEIGSDKMHEFAALMKASATPGIVVPEALSFEKWKPDQGKVDLIESREAKLRFTYEGAACLYFAAKAFLRLGIV